MDEADVLRKLIGSLDALVGTEIFRDVRTVPSSGRVRPTEPYLIFERLVGELLREISSDAQAVSREPLGAGQYPDWSLATINFEVKSASLKSKRFMVGAVKKMAEAFSAGDCRYLTTHYVVFYYSLLYGNRLRVEGVDLGKIWKFSKPTAARSGRRPQWPSSRVGTDSLDSWKNSYLENTAKRGFPVDSRAMERALERFKSRAQHAGGS